MKKVKYLKQFRSILSDLVLEKEKGNIEEYFYTWVKAYLVKIHNLMNINGKKLVFRAMYLETLSSCYIRSQFEIYACLLVSKKFNKRELIELYRRRLNDLKNNS